jgi:hypothetical protein
MSEGTNSGNAKKKTANTEPEGSADNPMTVRLSTTDRILSGAQLAVQGANAIFSGLAAFDSHDQG